MSGDSVFGGGGGGAMLSDVELRLCTPRFENMSEIEPVYEYRRPSASYPPPTCALSPCPCPGPGPCDSCECCECGRASYPAAPASEKYDASESATLATLTTLPKRALYASYARARAAAASSASRSSSSSNSLCWPCANASGGVPCVLVLEPEFELPSPADDVPKLKLLSGSGPALGGA